jgi:hypothetical protein
MKTVAAATMVTGVFLLSACGGGSSGGASGAGQTPASTSSFPKAAAQAAAQKALLTSAQFPSNWTQQSSPATPLDAQAQQMLATCLHVPASELQADPSDVATADSPQFEAPGGVGSVQETVDITTTAHEVAEFQVLAQSQVPTCLGQVFGSYLKSSLASSTPGVTVGTLTMRPLTVSQIGDATDAFQATIPVTANGQSITLYVDLVFLRSANADIVLTLVDQSSISGHAAGQYAGAALQRLQAVNPPAA